MSPNPSLLISPFSGMTGLFAGVSKNLHSKRFTGGMAGWLTAAAAAFDSQ